MKPRKYKKRAGGRRAPKGARAKPGRMARAPQAAPAAALWALRSDGAFVLLGTSVEIPRVAGRSLVEFIRMLDGGEASA